MRCDKCALVFPVQELRDIRVVSFGGASNDYDPLDYELPDDGVGLDLCADCSEVMVALWNNLCDAALRESGK